MVRIEDIVFWILIILIIATALWLLHGSPAESSALITLALFVATSEVLLWKALFKIDRKTSIEFVKLDKSLAISFIKIKNDMHNKHNELKDLIKSK